MLINIQFLRFAAALLVVFHHAAAHVRVSGHGAGLLFDFGRTAGFAGVDIFFVISGFIMVWTTETAAGFTDAASFIRRRVARIYSGYWPFYLLALGLFWVLGGRYLANVHLLESLVLWPTALQHLLIPVSWTLIFELWFYLLFAVLIAVGGRRRMWLLGSLALAMLAWTGFTQFVRQAYDPGRLEAMSIYEQYLAFPYLLEFLAGAMLAGVLRRRPQGRSWPLLLAGAGLFVAGGWINDAHFDGRLIQGYFIVWRVLIFGTASVLLLAGLVRLELHGRTFAPRFSLLAGGASYALYLSHTLILAATHEMGFDSWTAQFPRGLAHALYFGLIAGIVAYSIAHYRWLERPLHRAFRRWLHA